MRRAKMQDTDQAARERDERRIRFGRLEIDLAKRNVYRDGAELDIPPRVFDLLHALVRREGAVARREELLRDVWGHRNLVSTRTVDLHVHELRRKIEDDPTNPHHILTVRKAGYRFQR